MEAIAAASSSNKNREIRVVEHLFMSPSFEDMNANIIQLHHINGKSTRFTVDK